MIKLNRTTLKYIAALAMLIDHIGMMLIPITTPLGLSCRIIGRLTAPIMCFFLAEGYEHTRSKYKYGIRLLIFALISQPFYAYAHGNTILEADFNMIFTLFLSFMVLVCYDRIENGFLRYAVIFVITGISFYGDWGVTAPLWVLGFHCFRENKRKTILYFSAVAIFWIIRAIYNCINRGFMWRYELCQLGLFMFPFMYLCYNGEKGSDSKFSKWFFYAFYPLHLLVLALIKNFG